MKKFMKKVLKVLPLVLVMVMVMSPMALGMQFGSFQPDINNDLTAPITKAGNTVTGVVKVVGYIIAVVMVMVLGINYIIATPAKKAELKGKLWSMAIGVLLLVGGVTILDVIANGFTGITESL